MTLYNNQAWLVVNVVPAHLNNTLYRFIQEKCLCNAWPAILYVCFYTTRSNFSTKYLVMYKVYTDIGGIK